MARRSAWAWMGAWRSGGKGIFQQAMQSLRERAGKTEGVRVGRCRGREGWKGMKLKVRAGGDGRSGRHARGGEEAQGCQSGEQARGRGGRREAGGGRRAAGAGSGVGGRGAGERSRLTAGEILSRRGYKNFIFRAITPRNLYRNFKWHSSARAINNVAATACGVAIPFFSLPVISPCSPRCFFNEPAVTPVDLSVEIRRRNSAKMHREKC